MGCLAVAVVVHERVRRGGRLIAVDVHQQVSGRVQGVLPLDLALSHEADDLVDAAEFAPARRVHRHIVGEDGACVLPSLLVEQPREAGEQVGDLDAVGDQSIRGHGALLSFVELTFSSLTFLT